MTKAELLQRIEKLERDVRFLVGMAEIEPDAPPPPGNGAGVIGATALGEPASWRTLARGEWHPSEAEWQEFLKEIA